jgi:PBP superfamily domain
VRFVGSLESVVALCKNRCELAGFHIPQGALGREILRKYEPWLKPRTHRVVHFVRRNQGLLVATGNPLAIHTLKDIAGKGARFINRHNAAPAPISRCNACCRSKIWSRPRSTATTLRNNGQVLGESTPRSRPLLARKISRIGRNAPERSGHSTLVMRVLRS